MHWFISKWAFSNQIIGQITVMWILYYYVILRLNVFTLIVDKIKIDIKENVVGGRNLWLIFSFVWW